MATSEIGLNRREATAGQHRLNLFVLIDALGWRYVERHRFLADLLTYRQPLRTVLGFSSGAIPAILTGLEPARNGHWNLFYFDPAHSPFHWLKYFSALPDRILNHRVSRKIVKELGRRVLGLGPLFECAVNPRFLRYFNWVEKRSIYEPGGVAPAKSIFDHLQAAHVPYRVYSYHQWTDREILDRGRHDVVESDGRFYFFYLSEMDAFLHRHCGDEDLLERSLAWYAARLREVFSGAIRRDPEVGITILSDHGMTPVHHHYDLVRDVAALGLRMPADYLALYDSTMARFWLFSDRARRELTDALRRSPCGRILEDEELARLGVLFQDRRYGELIFLLRPGWLLSRSDFNGPQWMPSGMHGYHPDDPDSDGVFLSNRPPPIAVSAIADVYTCMMRAMEQCR